MKKIGNGVVALSSAAIIAVYAAGHARTRSAAEELEAASAQRRPVIPAPAAAGPVAAEAAGPSSRPGVAAAVPAGVAPPATPAAQAQAAPPVAAPSRTTPEKVSTAAKALAPAKAPVAAVSPNAAPGAAAAPAATAPAAEAAAATATPAADAAAAPAKKPWKDGTYRSWGRSRHGDMLAFVVIENGRIVHAGVDKCETRWPCTIVAHLYPQVLARQSAEVDYVTGATQSANAFYYGILDALAMAEGAAVDPRPIPQ